LRFDRKYRTNERRHFLRNAENAPAVVMPEKQAKAAVALLINN
jgi:hypothetical protein